MLPPWSKAEFRPSRRASLSLVTRPSVSAETAGAKTSPATASTLKASHRPESWSDKDNGGGYGHRRHGQNDHAALGVGHIDQGADRSLERDPEQSAGGCENADVGLAPMLARDEEYVDEWPEQ